MNDNEIIKIFFTEKGNRRSYNKIIKNNPNIKEYLDNRYKDETDYNRIIWRIKEEFNEMPLCPVCNKNQIKFRGTSQQGFAKTCCKKCRDILWHQIYVKSIKEKYGVENAFQAEICKEKIKKTNLERYGVECSLQNKEVRNKGIETCLRKYGVKNAGGAPEVLEKIKKTILERYGVEHSGCTYESLEKGYKTKRKNNSFSTSSEEDKVYNELLKYFNKEDVIRQYNSKEYPFNCDFYIKPLNLYIECNFHWTHGNHVFNENNKEDLIKLKKWKSKSSNYYKTAINVWTNKDLLKIKTAQNNNLNYKYFYNLNEAIQFISKTLMLKSEV